MEKSRKLSTTQVARLLGVSDQSVANWIDQGQLRAGRTPGGHRRVEADDLVVFLKQQKLRVPAELQPHRKVILIVDDEVGVAAMLSQVVRESRPDYKVVVATSGYAAGEAVATEKPDLVILDLYMPGIDGFEVCRRIKSNHGTSSVEVIAITAHLTPEAQKQIGEAGAAACLPKPLESQKLMQLVDSLLPPR